MWQIIQNRRHSVNIEKKNYKIKSKGFHVKMSFKNIKSICCGSIGEFCESL